MNDSKRTGQAPEVFLLPHKKVHAPERVTHILRAQGVVFLNASDEPGDGNGHQSVNRIHTYSGVLPADGRANEACPYGDVHVVLKTEDCLNYEGFVSIFDSGSEGVGSEKRGNIEKCNPQELPSRLMARLLELGIVGDEPALTKLFDLGVPEKQVEKVGHAARILSPGETFKDAHNP